MKYTEAKALCDELERLLGDARLDAQQVLRRVHDIERRFFAAPRMSGYLLATFSRVVSDLQEMMSDGGEIEPHIRAALMEGPIRDSLERLKSAVAVCYDRTPAVCLPHYPWRGYESELCSNTVRPAGKHP